MIRRSRRRFVCQHYSVFGGSGLTETQMHALHDVVKAGYARYIGMSSCHAYQCTYSVYLFSIVPRPHRRPPHPHRLYSSCYAECASIPFLPPSQSLIFAHLFSTNQTTQFRTTSLPSSRCRITIHSSIAKKSARCYPHSKYAAPPLIVAERASPNAQMFGVAAIPWCALGRGILTRPLSVQTKRGETDKYVSRPPE